MLKWIAAFLLACVATSSAQAAVFSRTYSGVFTSGNLAGTSFAAAFNFDPANYQDVGTGDLAGGGEMTLSYANHSRVFDLMYADFSPSQAAWQSAIFYAFSGDFSDGRVRLNRISDSGSVSLYLSEVVDGGPPTEGIFLGSLVPAVPELSEWAMMLLGVGMVGAAARHRRIAWASVIDQGSGFPPVLGVASRGQTTDYRL